MRSIEYQRVGQHEYYETIRVAANRVCTVEGSLQPGCRPRWRLLDQREWEDLASLAAALPERQAVAADDGAFTGRVVVEHAHGRRDIRFAARADAPVASLVAYLRGL